MRGYLSIVHVELRRREGVGVNQAPPSNPTHHYVFIPRIFREYSRSVGGGVVYGLITVGMFLPFL